MFKGIEELQVNSALFLVFLMKISTSVKDCQAIGDKTFVHLEPNINHKLNNNNVNSNVDPEKDSKVLALGDNIPCITNYPIIK